MAQSSWPFENVDTSETQYSLLFRQLQDSGVIGLPTGSVLQVVGDNSGLQVRVSAGDAIVRGHYYSNSIQETVTLTSAGTNTRIDAIVLELDPSANSILLKAIPGTAVPSNPTAPTLTQTSAGVYQMPLGYVTLPPSTTSVTSGMVADARTYTSTRLGVWTTGTRPATPFQGQTGFNFTLQSLESWTGSAWSSVGGSDVSPFLLMGA